MLRPEAPPLIPSALVADPSIHHKAEPADFQHPSASHFTETH